MSRSRFLFAALLATVGCGLAPIALAAPPVVSPAKPAQLATYKSPAGATYFALSVWPQVQVPATATHDVVVLFDTSASQTGPFREKALAALDAMLKGLGAKDRVQLLAVDLKAERLTTEFVAPSGSKIDAAVRKLRERVPLGATDLSAGLQAASACFDAKQTAAKAVVYIGDGMSTANLLAADPFRRLVAQLRQQRIPVSCYAIGPRIDGQLLAILANQTGGVLAVSRDPVQADAKQNITADRARQENVRQAADAGKRLAQAARDVVLWVQSARWPQAIKEVFPKPAPPLRKDRATVFVGTGTLTGPVEIQMTAAAAGQPAQLKWTVTPAASNPDNTYLAKLVEQARHDSGLTLPTIGTAGLAEARRVITSGTQSLDRLARQAVATGNYQSAEVLAGAALKADPTDPEARTIQSGARRLRTRGGAAAKPTDLKLVAPPTAKQSSPAAIPAGSDQAPPEEDDGALVDQVEAHAAVVSQAVQTEVRATLEKARRRMADNPGDAIQDLKLMLQNVRNVPELKPAVQAQLVDRIQAALKEASRREIEKTDRDQRVHEAVAAARELQRINNRLTRRIDQTKQLVERLRSLLQEQRYADATEEVAPEIEKLNPGASISKSATLWARLTRSYEEQEVVKLARWRGVYDTLYQAELSSVPFPDDPPIVYPPAADWEALSQRRKKWAQVDLSESGPAERKIRQALEDSTSVHFLDTPLTDAMTQLQEMHGINIVLDTAALDDEGISSDTPVTLDLEGLTLRSVLRLLLGRLNLTYVIENEVLLITTPTKAEDELTTKVYPVADLVLPISLNMGGMGGMMGGGMMGGGMGGMGGGMGGMGGGMGGMGGMGGGMGGMGGGMGGMGGGFFSVADDVGANQKPRHTTPESPGAAAEKPATLAPKPTADRTIEVDESVDPRAFWDRHFSQHREDPAVVRRAVRQLIAAHKPEQVVALIQAALRHDQVQPWMFEAMGLALQIAGRPKAEIERALMSAADFSDSAGSLMYIAQYLARIGLDRRALQLAEQAAKIAPMRDEPYLLGLRVAERLDDLDGIRWATIGILGRAWTDAEKAVEQKARRAALATVQRLRKDGHKKQADAFARQLAEAQVRDCVIKVSWTGEADIDLQVEEPSGTICSLRNPRTTGGGVIQGDSFSRLDPSSADQATETYVCAKGFKGTYRALVRRVWGNVTAGKVTVDVYTNYGGKNARHERKQIALGDDQALVRFALTNARRQEPLAQVQLANAAQGQAALNRAILAQQLSALSDPNVAPNRARFPLGGVPLVARGAVGYQPVITVLPSGTTFSVTGVISADRRYVRITPSMFVTDVTDVSTFTFAGAAQPAPGQGTGTGTTTTGTTTTGTGTTTGTTTTGTTTTTTGTNP